MDLKDFVLSGFSGDEKAAVEKAIRRAADGAVCFLEKGIERAMGEYNVKE
jgi:peptidyl-tRNA hydrolase